MKALPNDKNQIIVFFNPRQTAAAKRKSANREADGLIPALKDRIAERITGLVSKCHINPSSLLWK